MKSKIIHIVNLQSYGGIQKLTLELTSLLNSMGDFENHVLATKNIDLLSKSLPSNVKIHKIEGQNFFVKYSDIRYFLKGFDVVHFHGAYTYIQLATLFLNKKIVYTEHGTLQKANIKSSLKHLIQKRIVGRYFLEKYVDKVIFISKWILKDLELRNKNQVVVYNGLKYQEPTIAKEKDFVLSIAARLVPKKRVNLAIDLMKDLKEYQSIKLKIIGDGPEMENLKDQAGNLLNQTIFFLGYRKDAYNLIASSDVYLMTTNMEPFGLVVLEAMMSETLVLALKDSGGPTEILQDGFKNLILDDLEAMSAAVLYWQNNIEEKRQIEQGLRKLYLKNYTLNVMAENYLKVYLNLITEKIND